MRGFPFAALHAPVAPFTREVRTDLASGVAETEREPISFARPVRILGLRSVVLDIGDEDLLAPTVDVILACLEVEEENFFTRRARTPQANPDGPNFVTLSHLDVVVPRLLNLELRDASPCLGLRYRWDRAPTGGVGLYNTCRIKTAIFWDYIDAGPSTNVA